MSVLTASSASVTRRRSPTWVARIEQHAFADFLARGEVDRHLRRMRLVYRRRRDLLVEAVAAHLPGARIHGIAAGLHVAVVLPVHVDERRVREETAIRGINLRLLDDYTGPTNLSPTTLMLGYGRVREPAIRPGVAALAEALAAAREAVARRRGLCRVRHITRAVRVRPGRLAKLLADAKGNVVAKYPLTP